MACPMLSAARVSHPKERLCHITGEEATSSRRVLGSPTEHVKAVQATEGNAIAVVLSCTYALAPALIKAAACARRAGPAVEEKEHSA
jgi:hypothetical protein